AAFLQARSRAYDGATFLDSSFDNDPPHRVSRQRRPGFGGLRRLLTNEALCSETSTGVTHRHPCPIDGSIQDRLNKLLRRAVFVHRNIMVHQGRRGVPDPALAANANQAVAASRIPTEVTRVGASVSQDRMPANLGQHLAKRFRGPAGWKLVASLQPADVDNSRPKHGVYVCGVRSANHAMRYP